MRGSSKYKLLSREEHACNSGGRREEVGRRYAGGGRRVCSLPLSSIRLDLAHNSAIGRHTASLSFFLTTILLPQHLASSQFPPFSYMIFKIGPFPHWNPHYKRKWLVIVHFLVYNSENCFVGSLYHLASCVKGTFDSETKSLFWSRLLSIIH